MYRRILINLFESPEVLNKLGASFFKCLWWMLEFHAREHQCSYQQYNLSRPALVIFHWIGMDFHSADSEAFAMFLKPLW
jgi:hypothetical protein